MHRIELWDSLRWSTFPCCGLVGWYLSFDEGVVEGRKGVVEMQYSTLFVSLREVGGMFLVDGVRLACTLHLKSINSNFLIFLVSFFNEIIITIIIV